MSSLRKTLCWIYGAIALVALVATWSQNLQYFIGDGPPGGGSFLPDLKVNPAARSFTVDIGLFLLAAAAFMVSEARKLKMGWTVWLYIVLGFAFAISVTFPLFMIARELRLSRGAAGESRLTMSDILGLGVTTALVAGLSWYVLR
jgi:Terpene cyclase DEP1